MISPHHGGPNSCYKQTSRCLQYSWIRVDPAAANCGHGEPSKSANVTSPAIIHQQSSRIFMFFLSFRFQYLVFPQNLLLVLPQPETHLGEIRQ